MNSFKTLRSSTFLRYVLIGSTAFLLDFGLFSFGLNHQLAKLVANTISTSTAIIYSFVAHRFFTFRSQMSEQGYHYRFHSQAVVFVVVSLIAILLSNGFVHLFADILKLDPRISKILASAILFVWNYVVNRALTFRGRV